MIKINENITLEDTQVGFIVERASNCAVINGIPKCDQDIDSENPVKSGTPTCGQEVFR
jgi:hypothetical protein